MVARTRKVWIVLGRLLKEQLWRDRCPSFSDFNRNAVFANLLHCLSLCHFLQDGSVEGLDRRLKTTQKEIPADEVTASHEPRRLGLGDWTVCKSSSECNNGCCSGTYSNGVLKCTPLNGGYRPDLCTSTATGGTCGNGNRGDGKCANGQCCSQVSAVNVTHNTVVLIGF